MQKYRVLQNRQNTGLYRMKAVEGSNSGIRGFAPRRGDTAK